MTFTFPTYADFLNNPESPKGKKYPCQCGRSVPAFMLLDVRSLPLELRPNGADFICDGCKARLHLQGVLSYEQFAQYCDAPDDILAACRRLDGN